MFYLSARNTEARGTPMNIQDTHRLLITLNEDEDFRVNARSDYGGVDMLLAVRELEISTFGDSPQGVKLRFSGWKVRNNGTTGNVYTTCTEWTSTDAGQAIWDAVPNRIKSAVRDSGIRI
jgi:hypothetical protein